MRQVLLIISLLSAKVKSQTTSNNLLIGRWGFERLYSDDKLSGDQIKQLKDMNNANIGLIMTFKPDGKFFSYQKNGKKENNQIGS